MGYPQAILSRYFGHTSVENTPNFRNSHIIEIVFSFQTLFFSSQLDIHLEGYDILKLLLYKSQKTSLISLKCYNPIQFLKIWF